MKRKTVCYLLSNIDKAVAFEWIATQLSSTKFNLHFILLNPSHSNIENYLSEKNIDCKRIPLRSKKDYPKALFTTLKYFKHIQPDIIHCHMFDATIIGLLSGKIAGIKKRIYTRHHSTYNHKFNKKGVLLDKVCNYLATDIVAISQNVKNVLLNREHVPDQKITLIHHGFDLNAFETVPFHDIEHLKNKYNIHEQPVIGVIARWIEWKGIQYIIPAFKKILAQYPNAVLILANANGPFSKHIQNLLHEIPKTAYRIIGFENNLFALYQLFDTYVHTPIDPEIEAFGQTYVEALAAGVPSIFTLSGVAHEFIENEQNALVIPYSNSTAIYEATKSILKNEDLRVRLIKKGKKDIQGFQITTMIDGLTLLYEKE